MNCSADTGEEGKKGNGLVPSVLDSQSLGPGSVPGQKFSFPFFLPYVCQQSNSYHTIHPLMYCAYVFFKASQPRGRASGSHAYERHEMQDVILKRTRHECSVCEPKATPGL